MSNPALPMKKTMKMTIRSILTLVPIDEKWQCYNNNQSGGGSGWNSLQNQFFNTSLITSHILRANEVPDGSDDERITVDQASSRLYIAAGNSDVMEEPCDPSYCGLSEVGYCSELCCDSVYSLTSSFCDPNNGMSDYCF